MLSEMLPGRPERVRVCVCSARARARVSEHAVYTGAPLEDWVQELEQY